MAVESCIKRDMEDEIDDSDEEKPLVFKRSTSSSRPSQVNPEVKKSSSQPQRRDGQSGAVREASNLHSPHNGLSSSSNPQKSKAAPPAKPSSMRSPLASPKASNSSGKASPVVSSKTEKQGTSVLSGKVSPVVNSRTEKQGTSVLSGKVSPVVNSKTQKQGTSVLSGKVSPMRSSVPNAKASTRVASTSVKAEAESLKRPRQSNIDDEDTDDDKPLSTKIKVNSHLSSPPPQPKTSVKKSPDDSDDEKPLNSKYPLKSSAGSSGSKPSDRDDKKPLATKLQQNGSDGRDNQGKSSTVLSKRPVEKPNPSSQLLASKKPKLSGTSLPAKVKEVSVKAETKRPVKLDNVSSTKPSTSKPASSSKGQEKASKDSKYSKSTNVQPSSGDGQKKWTTLAHNGVIFPPPYQPHGVKILYRGKPVDLTPEQEEVATMYAMMIDTDYMQKEKFKENFWEDWRKILGRKHVIQSLEDCDFTPIYDWYQKEKEKKKQMSSEEKKILKEEKFKQEEKYMWAVVDGVKEKVGNFRVEPPGLFRGRGEHPKMGKLKRRIHPSDITINIGKDAPVPECPIPGENWKEIRNDNTVTWLAFWNDPINPKEFKYVFLAASSSLKGQSDKEKYEKARTLKGYIDNIRAAYTKAFTSKDVTKQQIAVATYLIDKLALRAGNEKDDDEADTVGCCTLKIENVTALPQSNKLEFNFLGKDSIKYENVVEVEPLVYKAILQFQAGKKEGDDLFDKLDTSKLNAHLKELMPGLTAKVFRTYNASITLDKMLYSETKDGDVPEKVAVYNYANKQVAIICNHQRSISKSHATQMTKLEEKLNDLKGNLKELRTDLDRAKKGKPPLKDADGKQKRNLSPEALEKKIAQINVKIEKTERDMMTKEDLKTVALGTSKINYLDPRITVAWCKRHEVPIEKMFTKSLLAKFSWAMDVEPDFRF